MSRTKGTQPRRSIRLTPSADLSKDAQAVFRYLVQSVAPDHFSEVDLPLLESYATAICNRRVAQAAIDRDGQVDSKGRVSPWITALEKAVRSEVALSMRLRLSPQSRFDRTAAGVTSRPQPNSLTSAHGQAELDDRFNKKKLAYYRIGDDDRRKLVEEIGFDALGLGNDA